MSISDSERSDQVRGMPSGLSATLCFSIFLSVLNCYSPLVYDRQLLLDIKDSVVTTYNSELASSIVRSQSCFTNIILDIPAYLHRWHPDISRRKRRKIRGGVAVKPRLVHVHSFFCITRNLSHVHTASNTQRHDHINFQWRAGNFQRQ